MTTMANLTEEQIRCVEREIHRYLWQGKRACIAVETLTKSKEDGGLRLVDLRAKQKSIKIKWIFMLDHDRDPFLSTCAFNALSKPLGQDIWRANLKKGDVRKVFQDSFWRQVLEAWSELNFKEPQNRNQVENQFLWFNSNLRINNSPFFWLHWYSAGIRTLRDLLGIRGDLFPLKTFLLAGGQEPGWSLNQ